MTDVGFNASLCQPLASPLSSAIQPGQLPPSQPPPSPAQPPTERTAPAETANPAARRTVCDHCRQRRIRCDGRQPCQQCVNAQLICRRDHVPLKRGPKRGRGRVINELRERFAADGSIRPSREYSTELPVAASGLSTPVYSSASASVLAYSPPPALLPETRAADFSSREQFRPVSRNYMPLVPQCVELYYKHVYPIMPLPYMPSVLELVGQPVWPPADRNYIMALCALTCFHMSGQNIATDAPTPSWEAAGRFFLAECLATGRSYEFFSEAPLQAIIASFWVSTSFFEINRSLESWLYLREALSLAQEMRLDDDAAYEGLDTAQKLCRQRVFWQLFVTERSFAVLRNKPITLKKTPSLPTTRHHYEKPEIHSGFLQLIGSYAPLDEAFVNAWNDGSDPSVTASTYLALQRHLAQPPGFLSRSSSAARAGLASEAEAHISGSGNSGGHFLDTLATHFMPEKNSVITSEEADEMTPRLKREDSGADDGQQLGRVPPVSAATAAAAATATADSLSGEEAETTTAIQKADLLITQQWLRLIVWQSSFRQQLLSSTATDESMQFTFPLTIASRTAAVLQCLPPEAIEVHGMGIFEKIFEISSWYISVLNACNRTGGMGGGHFGSMSHGGGGGGSSTSTSTSSSRSSISSIAGSIDDMGALSIGRKLFTIDPLEFFVRTLSMSPNSKIKYADGLLAFARDHPGSMRLALSPAPSAPLAPSLEFVRSPPQPPKRSWSLDDMDLKQRCVSVSNSSSGSVLGEVMVGNSFSGSLLGESLADNSYLDVEAASAAASTAATFSWNTTVNMDTDPSFPEAVYSPQEDVYNRSPTVPQPQPQPQPQLHTQRERGNSYSSGMFSGHSPTGIHHLVGYEASSYRDDSESTEGGGV